MYAKQVSGCLSLDTFLYYRRQIERPEKKLGELLEAQENDLREMVEAPEQKLRYDKYFHIDRSKGREAELCQKF